MLVCFACMYTYLFIDEKTTRLYFLFSYLPDILEVMCGAFKICVWLPVNIFCVCYVYIRGRESFHSYIALML